MENKERLDIAFKRINQLVKEGSKKLVQEIINLPVMNKDLTDFLEESKLGQVVSKEELSDYLDIFSWSNVQSSVYKTMRTYFRDRSELTGYEFYKNKEYKEYILLVNTSTYTGITIREVFREEDTRTVVARFIAEVLLDGDDMYTRFRNHCYHPTPEPIYPFSGHPRETKLLLEDIDTMTE